MKLWSRFPLIRLILPFILGNTCCFYNIIPLEITFQILLIAFTFCLIFSLRNYFTGKHAIRWLGGFPFMIFFFLSGYRFASEEMIANNPNLFSSGNPKNSFLIKLTEPPHFTYGKCRFEGVRFSSTTSNQPQVKFIITIDDSTSKLQSLLPGDFILVHGTAKFVEGPTNPGQFDYRRYLATKGIFYQIFADKNNYELPSFSPVKSWYRTALQVRLIMLKILSKHIPSQAELGVGGALLLGYEEWMDPDVERSYSGAGVLHVLCVSGMHVGLMFFILASLLQWMDKSKFLRHLRFPFLVACMWFYAMVTGFSPSVIRAAAMITFIILGKWMDRKSDIMNILGGSVFLMMLLDPFLIFSAGFQLSFLAVCGIVFIHPVIMNFYKPDRKIIHKVWELISVSIAAQIATFPISIFFFHQFPNYFLLANLIIIPVSSIVMYSGLLLLVTDWIPFLGQVVGWVTAKGLWVMNSLVLWLGKLPLAMTTEIPFSCFQMILVYMMIIFFFCWISLRFRNWFFLLLLSIILFLGSQITWLWISNHRQSITVFDTPGQSVITLIKNRTCWIIYSDSKKFQKNMNLTRNYLTSCGIVNIHPIEIPANKILETSLNNELNKMIIINGIQKYQNLPTAISEDHFDVAIFAGKSTKMIADSLKSELKINDSSFRVYQHEMKAEIRLLSTKKSGAVTQDF